ncbi:MAG: hypothetical protein JWP44_4931 [Mucilaginibacter sp.]|nr:hypothetical protein [Mucilaginibacter sp.]
MEAYSAKRPNLVRFLAARLGSRHQAEDVVQDLFLKLAAINRDTVVENATALIYRMASNLAVDHVRSQRRSVARDSAWAGELRIADGELVADAPAVDDAFAARQRLERLVKRVSTLPPRMQQAFRLHKFEGHTHAETARLMGVSVKAVEKQISAALKVLAWSDDEGEQALVGAGASGDVTPVKNIKV